MKQLDHLWTELQPFIAKVPPVEQEPLNTAFARAQKGVTLIESKYHRAIRDRAAVHALLKHSSEDLIQRYQTLFENSGTAMAVVEQDGTLSLVNTVFLNLLGYRRDEVENRKNIFDIVDKPSREEVMDYHRRRLAGDDTVPHRYETRIVNSGGTILEVIVIVGLFPGTTQSVISIIDITDRKRMEDELRLFKASSDNAYDEIFWLDFEGRLLYVNDSATHNTGYSREELLSMKIFSLDPDFDPAVWQGFIADLRKEKKLLFTTRHLRKNGEIMDVEIVSNYVTKDSHEYSFAFVRDITERKRMTDELRLFKASVDHANDEIFWFRFEGNILYVNDAAIRVTGYSREELLAMKIFDLNPHINLDIWEGFLNQLQKDGSLRIETGHRRKNGEIMDVEIVANYVAREGTEYSIAFVRDITERKRVERNLLQKNDELNAAYEQLAAVEQELRANYENLAATEKKLRESEAWSREFAELLPQFVFEIDTAGRFLFANQLAADVFGITREMLDTGVNMRDFIIPEEWEQVQRNLTKILAGRKTTYDIYHCRKKDGTLMPANIYTAPVYRDGTLAGYRGIVVDITEALRTQEALQKSEIRFRELAELLPQIVFELDENLKFTFFNWNTIEMTGYAYDDLSQNRVGIYEIIREPDRQSAEQFFARIMRDKTSGHLTCGIVSLDGKEIPAIISASPIISENRVAGVRGVIVDITEQKNLELALRESEVRFRELAELAPQFIFEADRNFRFTWFNWGALAIAGYSIEDTTQGFDVLSIVDTADRSRIRETFERSLKGEEVQPLQFSLIKKDREELPVIMYTSPIIRENEYAGIRGIIVDIADQKKLEIALETTNKKLNLMNSVTRHDVLNNITGLLGLVDMLGEIGADSNAQVLITEIHDLIIRIKDQIIFTRDYQSVGVKAPQWQSLCQGIRYATSAIGLDMIQLKMPVTDAEIFADPFFGRVFYNLIDNSFRHGGSVRIISVDTTIEPDGSLIIRYRDDGIGVPVDEKELIFKQGYGKNTGFGLFIIREILGITGLTIRENGTFRTGVLFEITVPKGSWRPLSGEGCEDPDAQNVKDENMVNKR